MTDYHREAFPTKCPHCGSFARYEHSKVNEGGVHTYGLTTWECGYALQRTYDEEFSRAIEFEPGRCRRTPIKPTPTREETP